MKMDVYIVLDNFGTELDLTKPFIGYLTEQAHSNVVNSNVVKIVIDPREYHIVELEEVDSDNADAKYLREWKAKFTWKFKEEVQAIKERKITVGEL